MKVKLLVSRAGPAGVQNAGDVVDVSADEARRMCEVGQAEMLRSEKPEKAVKRAKAEKAVK